MMPELPSGIVEIPANHSVEETVTRLQTLLREKGITLFAIVDHSGEAQKAGLTMPPTKLLIFGNPRGGTPVMLASPSAAIDLPLKILVREGPDGKALIAYNTPQYLRDRHQFPEALAANLGVVEMLARKAADLT